MSDSRDVYEWFSNRSLVPVSRIRYYPIATAAVIREMKSGVLFIMAWWSGSSQMAFCAITKTVATLDPEGRLEVVVVDTDGCPEIHELPEFFGKTHGYGETAWVLHGQIRHTSGLGYHPECFEKNTQRLLEQIQP